ncbi:MAG: cyanophycin synthetase [Gammaproteobacteria bacterium]|nr:cyanophycin synthetase [Gammaproteobacteria bacterium]
MNIKKIKFLNQINRWKNKKIIEILVESFDLSTPNLESLTLFLENNYPFSSLIFQEKTEYGVVCLYAKFILKLQQILGCKVDYRECKKIESQDNLYYILVEYEEKDVAIQIIDMAFNLLMNFKKDLNKDYHQKIYQLTQHYEDVRMGPSTQHIVDAAVRQNIPYKRLTTGSLIQFGHGLKQRRIQAGLTDNTSSISDGIAQDKWLTKNLLKSVGIPVAEGVVVHTIEEALREAEDIGYPVVIKPLDGNQGKGVTVNIIGEEQFREAFAHAQKYGDEILLEEYIPGDDYRLLVVGNRLIAAAQRVPPMVMGDGQHTIQALIDQVNQDPLRLNNHNGFLTKITVDQVVIGFLKQQNLSIDSIPAAGQKVFLRLNANLSTGGYAIDVTDKVHVSIQEQAIRAAQMIGIDICGVDLVCKDITKPLKDHNGFFIEMNLAPGLRMHIAPSYGEPRDVGKAIIEHMFKQDDARIPIIAVTGNNGKTTTSRLIAFLLEKMDFNVGLTCTDGIYFNGRKIIDGDCSGPWSAESILMHPEVSACVLETARGGILRQGLGYDVADIAVVTNIGEADHLGLDFIENAQDIASVKQTVVRSVSPKGTVILNADDPLVVAMATYTEASCIYFSYEENHPILDAHFNAGGTVIFYNESVKAIQLKNHELEHHFDVQTMGVTEGGLLKFQIQNVMATIGVMYALKMSMDLTQKFCEQFKNTPKMTPGRFNLFKSGTNTIIADYAHNIDALAAIIETIEKFPAKKRLVLTSSAGDRSDQVILRQMKMLGDVFDEGIVYQDLCQRNRKDGEVVSLIQQGLKNGRRMKKIDCILNEMAAISFAIDQLDEDCLCLLLIDDVENALQHIQHSLEKSFA